MRRGLIACVAVALLASASLAGQTGQPAFTAGDRTDIEAVVRGYFAAFTAKDYTAFGKFFQAPFASIGRDNILVPTVDEVVARYRSIREPLDQADYSESTAAEIRVTPITFERALADVHWKRLKKDKTLLVESAEFLIMSKTSGTWKISGVMTHQLPLFAR